MRITTNFEPYKPTAEWVRNPIDYRHSLANIWRRKDRDETPVTCNECGCETDIDPAPHSARCPN